MLFWPLSNRTPLFPDPPGLFAAVREFDIHTGIDLYCELGTFVTSMEAGTVVYVDHFTGSQAGSPWWNDTMAVFVEGESGVLNYGEVTPLVAVGDVVRAGQVIALVERPVLKTYKDRPQVMLHFEQMRTGTRKFYWWNHHEPKPEPLRDPCELLLHASGMKHTVFDLNTYDGKAFRG